MRTIPGAVAAISLVCASSLCFAADITFHRSLTANGSGAVALNVCTKSGIIHVHGVDGNMIDISAKIHKSNWHVLANTSEMKEIAAKPPIQQTGNAIHVGDEAICGGHEYQNVDIDYEISIPKNSTVVASSGAGNIRVESVAGFVHANTGSGDIVANGIGPDSKLQASSGTIDIQDARGALQAQTASGNVDLRDSQVSEARLRTSSGNITTSKVNGGLRAGSSSGGLTIGGLPASDWQLETSSGNIRFTADANAKFNLDAESGSGKVVSTLPGTIPDHANNVVKISVNGGGPEVRMYTSSGNIDLK